MPEVTADDADSGRPSPTAVAPATTQHEPLAARHGTDADHGPLRNLSSGP